VLTKKIVLSIKKKPASSAYRWAICL